MQKGTVPLKVLLMIALTGESRCAISCALPYGWYPPAVVRNALSAFDAFLCADNGHGDLSLTIAFDL